MTFDLHPYNYEIKCIVSISRSCNSVVWWLSSESVSQVSLPLYREVTPEICIWFKFHWSFFWGANWHKVSIYSVNGLVLNRQQAITLTIGDQDLLCHTASISPNELKIRVQLVGIKRFVEYLSVGNMSNYLFISCFQDSSTYVIDEGPLLPSLEHLVEYYCVRNDGLPCRLTLAISQSEWQGKKCI